MRALLLSALLLAPILSAQTTWHLNREAEVKALHPIIEGHPAFTPEGIHFSGKV